MAYDKDKIYELAKEVIIEHTLYFVEDVVSLLPCSKPTFYEFFPIESNELNTLKELLDKNKINTKVRLRKKLEQGDKAAEILALYKLIATPEERSALSMQQIDHTTQGEKLNVISLGNGTAPQTE